MDAEVSCIDPNPALIFDRVKLIGIVSLKLQVVARFYHDMTAYRIS